MSRWFRMYDDLLDDPKVQKLPPVLFKAWVNMLCLASRNEGRLPDVDDMAFSLRQDAETVKAWLAELSSKGLIDEVDGEPRPHNWDKRQFKTDNSTERSRKHRSSKGETADATPMQRECNVAATADATPPEQNRTEQIQSRAEQTARAQDPQHWEEVQGYLRDKSEHLTDWEIDFLHSIKWAETLSKPQSDSLKAIAGKLKSPAITGQEVFIIKNGTPEFAAWIAHDKAKGLKTTFKENLREMTVPSLFPPELEKAA